MGKMSDVTKCISEGFPAFLIMKHQKHQMDVFGHQGIIPILIDRYLIEFACFVDVYPLIPFHSVLKKSEAVRDVLETKLIQSNSVVELRYVHLKLSQYMRFPTMWYVRLAKPQISLRIRTVWSEPLQVAWVFYDC